MGTIEQFLSQNPMTITTVIFIIFLIMAVIISAYEIIGKFSEIINKPVKWVKKKNEDHQLLIYTVKSLNDLKTQHNEDVHQSIRHDEVIEKKLNKLTSIILEKSIEDFRWEILDFSSALSNGRKYNLEAYNHIFKIYEKYEKILRDNGMENGLVEESIKFIREKNKKKLKNGETD